MEESSEGGDAGFPTYADPSCCPLDGNYANIESILAFEPSPLGSPNSTSGPLADVATTTTIDSPSSYHTADNPGIGDSGARDTPTGGENSPHVGSEDLPTATTTTTSSDPPTLDAEDATLDADDVTNGGDDDPNGDAIKKDDVSDTYDVKKDAVAEDVSPLHQLPSALTTQPPTKGSNKMLSTAASPAHERRFFCREWAWTKLWACMEQRPSAKTCGVLIIGGPGTGKTALCSQLVSPTGAYGRHASQLQSRLLAYHFCHAHEAASLSVATFIRSLVVQLAESPHLRGYGAKVAVPEVVQALDPLQLQRDPDEAFRRAVVFPLLEADSPERTLVLLVDSVDEDSLPLTYGGGVAPTSTQRGESGRNPPSNSQVGSSRTILELLSNHHHLLPQWLLLVLTARRGLHSRGLGRSFSGFRKVALDDLRRSHVVRDVQQYILCRLDSEPALRHHLSRETAEMLNQLHIKSNGCFLYLEKVLDGVAEGWVTLREIRDIPGTLNGLYLWLCQRLYPRKHFQRVLPLLSVILAARAPLTPQEVQEAVSTRVPGLGEEEWTKRWALLRRVLCPYTRPALLLFHHSFAEWLLDVKHCTQKFLVGVADGHAMLSMRATLKGPQLSPSEVQTFAFHLARVPLGTGASGPGLTEGGASTTRPGLPTLESFHLSLWLVCSGAPVAHCFEQVGLRDPMSFRLLQEAGAQVPSLEGDPAPIEGDEGDEEEFEDEGEEEDRPPRGKYEELRDEEGDATGGRKKDGDEETGGEEGEKEEATQTEKQKEKKTPPTEKETAPPLQQQQTNRQRSPEHATKTEARPLLEEAEAEDWCPPGDARSLRSSNGRRSGSSGSKCPRERRRRKHREDVLYPYLRGGPVDGVDAAGRTLLHTAAHQGDASLVGVLLQRGANPALTDRGGQTPLNLAARHGHADVVTALLTWGAEPDHADDDGWTSLRSAAWAGHVDVVEALLKGGARADLADGDGRTALRAAAWGGHEDVVATLLRCGAAVNRADSEGRTPLIAAAYMGHCEIVSALIAGGADVNHADKDGRSALSVAALCVTPLVGDPCAPGGEGRLQVVTALLEGGAHVDHEDKDGLTPLLVAAFEGHVDVCEHLLEYDADVDHVDRSGRTPLLAAASMGHAAVVERLLFWGCYVDHIDVEGRTVLSLAAAQGSQDTVRLLLDRGLDETHRDNAGWTPLHYAAFEGHRGVCEALLDGGARVNEVDNDGKHALVLAAQEGHADVVGSLLDAGAALHHTSHDGRSALRVAALEGHKDVVRLLLHRGADLHYKDADGRSTLYLLALEDRVDMAAFLLENGADVESRDLEGRTPLHVTAWQGHARTVELLLGRGARVDAEDHERRTPLQSAAWQGNATIVQILLQHGARADHCCSQGATALSIASQEGHEDCVALLLQFGANPAHSDRCGRTAIKVALKGGHHRLARMLEEHLEQQKGPHAKGTGLQSSPSQTSTAETKPCSSLLCPGLAASPAESPESTFEKRRSCLSIGGHSSSKSSCNLTNSTRSSGCGGGSGIPSQPPPTSVNSVVGSGFHHPHHLHYVSPHVHAHSHAHSQQQQYHHPQPPPPPHIPPVQQGPSLSPILSFTQQLQQCGRGARGRKNPSLPQPPLTPLDEPASPIYASPPISPVNETPPPPLPQRMNPVVALLDEDYALPCHRVTKRHPHHSQQRPCPATAPVMTEATTCHAAELSRKAMVVSSSSHVASHYPYIPQAPSAPVRGMGLHPQLPLPSQQVPPTSHSQVGVPTGGIGVGISTSGFTFTQDSHMRIILGSRSPEARPKRNGIVTNPSLKAAHAKAAHILRNGLPGGRPRQNPLRPNGLSLKKETPL